VGLPIATAVLAATVGLEQERAMLYWDVVLSCLNQAARRALEEMMESGNYEIQSEFLRKYVAKGKANGKAEAVLLVLETRGLAIPDEVRQRVLASSDLAELERWLSRAVVAGSASEIFEP
jgi:hypothetical protein